ncbi:hypothetical protein FGIG_02513 [Fasciola gigantica]|uniref:Monocarboxylate transporter n=1 Tax=Fasciola gigantica TaxID=46835 RepID=A0A504YMK0_FASGI|nr:hypothetical protein FGIG_02513 [Fasciola gigantica]
MLEKIPNRVGALLGTLMTSGAIIASTFTNSFFTFMVPYTIFGGVGLGLTVIPVLGIMAEYFDRYRVLALALAASGSGFGTFIFSKLNSFLIETYTWRLALIAQALLHLNVFPLRLLLRPLAPEPVPEPTMLVPGHPDLTVCDLTVSKTELPTKASEWGPSNLIISLLSFSSMRSGAGSGGRFRGSVCGEEMPRRIRPNHDVRVVIEYVKMTRLPDQSDTIVTGPIRFLASPGPKVTERLESEARDYFTHPDVTTNTVLIPVMFLLGETDSLSVSNPAGSRRALDVAESNEYIGSRYDFGSNVKMDEVSKVYRQIVVGDTLASSMVAAHDRRQMKQTVDEVIRRGQKSIQETNTKLIERGLFVSSKTVTALIDQTDFFASTENTTNFGSDDRVRVLGYHGPEDAPIPEEVESDDERAIKLQQTTTKEANLVPDQSQKLDKQKTVTQSNQVSDSFIRPHSTTTKSRSRGSIKIGSTSQLSRVDKYGESCYRSRDLFASVISVNTPQQAASLLVSKLNNEAKQELVTTAATYREMPRFLLGDMLLLSFLVSRTLAFITDSVMYAHLSNFGLELGFGEERSASLLSFVGMTAMIGRLAMGFIGQFFERMDIRCTSAICLVCVSVFVTLIPVFYNYSVMSACCIIYGLLISPSFAFAPGMTFDIAGPQRYDEAVSYLFQFEALGFLIGGPAGGFIKEIRGRYLDCFLFSAVSEFCSGSILTVQTLINSKLWQAITRPRCKRPAGDLESADLEIEKVEDSIHETTQHCGSFNSSAYYGSSASVRGAG